MPYIDPNQRPRYDDLIEGLVKAMHNPGQLNYVLTRITKGFVDQEGVCYATLNEAIGVLECVKLELYRRLGVPYEDEKAAENGDVY